MKLEVSVSGAGKGVPRVTRKVEVGSAAAAVRKVGSLACPTHRWRPKATAEDDDTLDVLDVCCVKFRDEILAALAGAR